MAELDPQRHLPTYLLFEVASQDWTPAALARLRQPLSRPAAEEVGMLAAHDLARIVPSVSGAGLCMVGASFDATELLQPALPLFRCLAEQYRLATGSGTDGSRLLFLGALDGRLPVPELTPDDARPASPWRVLPMLLIAPPEPLAEIANELEERLLSLGECAPPLVSALGSWFGVGIVHARHLTQLDLLAILRAQYQQAGLEPLADMVEAALTDGPRQAVHAAADGAHVAWDGQTARLRWLPIDPEQTPPAGLRDALLTQRRLLHGLALHGIPHGWFASPAADPAALLQAVPLGTELVVEGEADVAVTRLRVYSDPELGTLVVDGLDGAGKRRCRMHPLGPQALARIRQLLPGREVELVALSI